MQPEMESPLNRSQSLASGLEKTSPTWKPPHSHSSSTLSSPHSRQVRVSTQNRWEFRGALIQDAFPTSASQRLGSDRRPAGRGPGRRGESSGHECSWNLWGIPPQEEEVATERMAQGQNPPPLPIHPPRSSDSWVQDIVSPFSAILCLGSWDPALLQESARCQWIFHFTAGILTSCLIKKTCI